MAGPLAMSLVVSAMLLAGTPQALTDQKTATHRVRDPRAGKTKPQEAKSKALEPWEREVLSNLELLQLIELLEKLDLLDDWQLFYEKGGRR